VKTQTRACKNTINLHHSAEIPLAYVPPLQFARIEVKETLTHRQSFAGEERSRLFINKNHYYFISC